MLKYLVISPVKDEKRYVEYTLESMSRQTVKPVQWLIVDDGSTDGTTEVLERWQQEHGFIRLVKAAPGARREPGGAVIKAFQKGYSVAGQYSYDCIVKLDCDLSLPPDYFEGLLRAFEADSSLGIASGVYCEQTLSGDWKEIVMPAYHAAGASKMVRRECYEQIGGFVPARGWDTVDEIRAMARGWRTRHLDDLKMRHWKPEGTGIGRFRTSVMHGEIYYVTGGSRMFFVLKVLHRMLRRPMLLGGAGLFWGYARAALGRRARLVTEQEARCYRTLLYRRLMESLKARLVPA